MTEGSPETFVANISRWVEEQKRNQDLYVRGVALAALVRLQELTPVDTGRLRASWQLDPPVAEIRAGETVSITTNVVYARRVEFGFVGIDSLGRHYNQRGAHMVEKTMAELPAIAEQVKKDLR